MTQNQIAYWKLQNEKNRLEHDKSYDYHKVAVDKDIKLKQLSEENRKNLANEAIKTAQMKIDEAFKKGQLKQAEKNFIKDTVLGSIGTALSVVGVGTSGLKNVTSSMVNVSKLM